ncbi:hypothetical protein ACGFZB_01375 [Streptomyces cinerochromogenes]|uniref:Uncharacterized protein n=1 Tax=Streptomyces cinerochromogenes TaxID=66422 RepID=A0ABW7AW50_9ACTN
MREATLHRGVASLTATAFRSASDCRAPKGRGAASDMRLPSRGRPCARRSRGRPTACRGPARGALAHAWKDAR